MPLQKSTEIQVELGNLRLSLSRLELIEVAVPQIESFKSAIGERNERRALLVRWWDRDGSWGIGENSCRPDPYFNGEFLAGAAQVISEFLFPQLPAKGRLGDFLAVLSRIRRWPFTISATLEAALDLLRREGQQDAIGCWASVKAADIPVGISLGLFPSPEAAVARVQRAVDQGYRRVKLKVHPGMNTEALAAIRSTFPSLKIGFDANGSGTEHDFDFFNSLADFNPEFLEQPFAPSRLDLCGAFRTHNPELRICLDESVADLGELIAAHRLHACDEINLKPGRVGGQFETVRILEYCREHQIPVWVGGMFETGIGRAANLRVAARLPEAPAHDLSPSGRYFPRDLLSQPIAMQGDGTITWREENPVELDEPFLEEVTQRKITLVKEN